jgi:REP element-mobilizing transposase RayT
MSRGSGRQWIVRDDRDREKRVDWIRRTVERYGWRLFAFVVMSNHDHLFLQTPEPNLSAGMQYLNTGYAGYFNRRHRRVGHVFQGWFKGHLVEEHGHHFELSRYLHLNPLRTRPPLVRAPEGWRWGSHAGYHRASVALDWIDYAAVLGEFGRDAVRARRAYRRFVRAGVEKPPESPWSEAVHGFIVGSEGFVQPVRGLAGEAASDPELPQARRLRQRPSLEAILAATAEVFQTPSDRWRRGRRVDDASRCVAAFVARSLGHRAKEIAGALGYAGSSGVAQAVRRVEEREGHLRDLICKVETRVQD